MRGNVQHRSILAGKFCLSDVAGHRSTAMVPKGIQSCTNANRLEGVVLDLPSDNTPPTNVYTLAIGALKGGAQMVPSPRFPEPDFIFHLSERRPIEVSGDRSLEVIQVVGDKAVSAPRPLALL